MPGFGFGNNAGVWAGLPDGPADVVYILNSDAFPAPDAIAALLDHLLQAHCGRWLGIGGSLGDDALDECGLHSQGCGFVVEHRQDMCLSH